MLWEVFLDALLVKVPAKIWVPGRLRSLNSFDLGAMDPEVRPLPTNRENKLTIYRNDRAIRVIKGHACVPETRKSLNISTFFPFTGRFDPLKSGICLAHTSPLTLREA